MHYRPIIQPVKPSEYGVFGEKIIWPEGYMPIRRKSGIFGRGESWLVRVDVEETLNDLYSKKRIMEEGIEKLIVSIKELNDEVADDEYSLDESDSDNDSEIDEYEEYNPHNKENTKVLLSEQELFKTKLEDNLIKVENDIQNSKKNLLKYGWKSCDMPKKILNIVKPWENFQYLNELRGYDSVQTDSADSVKNDSKLIIAKLYESGMDVTDDGCRIISSGCTNYKSSVAALIAEGKEVLDCQWKFLDIYSKNNKFGDLGILPFVGVSEITRTHRDFPTTYSAAFFSPLVENGNLNDIISRISSKQIQRLYSDSLIMNSIRKISKVMNFMSNHNIYHGNIKPSNIFISDDGFSLLIGDFCPKSEKKKWLKDSMISLDCVPNYISPEYYKQIFVKKDEFFSNRIRYLNPMKNDVFCFGLTIIYLCMGKNNDLYKDPTNITKTLSHLRQQGRSEVLVTTLENMLRFNESKRCTWLDLMTVTDKFMTILDLGFQIFTSFLSLNDKENDDSSNEDKINICNVM